MKVKIFNSVDENSWDSMVAGAEGGNIYQTSRWASFLKGYLGLRSVFFRVEEESGKTLALLRLTRESSFHRLMIEKPFERLLTSVADRMAATIRWQAGPVFLCENDREKVFEELLSEVERFCRETGIVLIDGAYNSIYEGADPSNLADYFSRHRGYEPREQATFLVDLRPDEDSLWQNVKQSARKAVRRSLEDGLRVERLKSESELGKYHGFVCDCRRSISLSAPTLRNITELWRNLHPAGMLEIFCAYRDNDLLGGLGIWRWGGVLIEWGSVQSEKARQAKLYSSDLLKWEVMRWGHQRGDRLYDLAGVVPQPESADPKQKGIYQFKAKWGGAFRLYRVYSKPFKRIRATVIQKGLGLIRRLRR